MIIIELTYKKPLEQVDKYLAEHRNYLTSLYQQNKLLASGPKNPRNGGIMIALTNIDAAEEMVNNDPFYVNDIADYSYIEFDPVKYHDVLDGLL